MGAEALVQNVEPWTPPRRLTASTEPIYRISIPRPGSLTNSLDLEQHFDEPVVKLVPITPRCRASIEVTSDCISQSLEAGQAITTLHRNSQVAASPFRHPVASLSAMWFSGFTFASADEDTGGGAL
jgi:hypothetical protein